MAYDKQNCGGLYQCLILFMCDVVVVLYFAENSLMSFPPPAVCQQMPLCLSTALLLPGTDPTTRHWTPFFTKGRSTKKMQL